MTYEDKKHRESRDLEGFKNACGLGADSLCWMLLICNTVLWNHNPVVDSSSLSSATNL